MKVLALISGGKDSILNILYCKANGYDVVALGNLYPMESAAGDDINSFMFQTVGHTFLPAISECLELPLYRKAIISSIEDAPEISYHCDNPEIESLYSLIEHVLSAHQDIEAVAVGAILSNYQRIRVENICMRLGLKCLAFLWRKEQADVLRDLREFGFDARVVKVAAIGLDKRHLNQSVVNLHDHLEKIGTKYGINVAGEGGEYETIVVDCPLFKSRIIIESYETFEEPSNQVAFIHNVTYHIEPKSTSSILLLDDILSRIRFKSLTAKAEALEQISPKKIIRLNHEPFPKIWRSERFVRFTGFACSEEESFETFFERLARLVSENGLTFKNACMTHVFLSDMQEFSEFNKIYGEIFGLDHPSARVCIGVGSLPFRCALNTTFLRNEKAQFEKMHVQSISYWAPANIGPYSQTVSISMQDNIPDFMFVSGQIGLIPETMKLPKSEESQVELSLRNLFRVIDASIRCDYSITDKLLMPLLCYHTSDSPEFLTEMFYKYLDQNFQCPLILFARVAELPRNALVELEAKYLLPPSERNQLYRFDEEFQKNCRSECKSEEYYEGDFIISTFKTNLVMASGQSKVSSLVMIRTEKDSIQLIEIIEVLKSKVWSDVTNFLESVWFVDESVQIDSRCHDDDITFLRVHDLLLASNDRQLAPKLAICSFIELLENQTVISSTSEI